MPLLPNINARAKFEENRSKNSKALREHLRAHKAVLYLRHSFIHFIDLFIHIFQLQIIYFV